MQIDLTVVLSIFSSFNYYAVGVVCSLKTQTFCGLGEILPTNVRLSHLGCPEFLFGVGGTTLTLV